MTRKVYFSFHYDNDIVRVSRIRNSGLLKEKSQTFLDKADWEKVKRSGVDSIKKWINSQMKGTSVLILCIGTETYNRRWVKHEIVKASDEGRGILGIYLNKMKDFNGNTIGKGHNPLKDFFIEEDGKDILLSNIFNTYSWVDDDGYTNIEDWVEEAAEIAGR